MTTLLWNNVIVMLGGKLSVSWHYTGVYVHANLYYIKTAVGFVTYKREKALGLFHTLLPLKIWPTSLRLTYDHGCSAFYVSHHSTRELRTTAKSEQARKERWSTPDLDHVSDQETRSCLHHQSATSCQKETDNCCKIMCQETWTTLHRETFLRPKFIWFSHAPLLTGPPQLQFHGHRYHWHWHDWRGQLCCRWRICQRNLLLPQGSRGKGEAVQNMKATLTL